MPPSVEGRNLQSEAYEPPGFRTPSYFQGMLLFFGRSGDSVRGGFGVVLESGLLTTEILHTVVGTSFHIPDAPSLRDRNPPEPEAMNPKPSKQSLLTPES